jgi:hypothetical protein
MPVPWHWLFTGRQTQKYQGFAKQKRILDVQTKANSAYNNCALPLPLAGNSWSQDKGLYDKARRRETLARWG